MKTQDRDFWRTDLWYKMPLVGTLLIIPMAAPASLFIALYGKGTYASFERLLLVSLSGTLPVTVIGAVLVGVPFDLLALGRRTLSARQTALARSLAYSAFGLVYGLLFFAYVRYWIDPLPQGLLAGILVWFPLGGATLALGYTFYEQLVRHMQTSARLSQELAVARAIQRGLFPHQPPQVDGLRFAARCLPARETGGDFYDFIHLGPGRIGIVVADVAGKSIAAALLMANVRSIWRATALTGASPRTVLERTNQALCHDIQPPSSVFVTLFYAIIDCADMGVRFAGAGHPPPILCHGISIRELDANGLPLGLVPTAQYNEAWVSLLPGDSLVMYTDGLVEALNSQREMFGFDRLHQHLALNQTQAPEERVADLLGAVQRFSHQAEQIDDLTLVAVQINVGAARPPPLSPSPTTRTQANP